MPLLQTLAVLGVKWPCAASTPGSSDVDPALEVLAELLAGEKWLRQATEGWFGAVPGFRHAVDRAAACGQGPCELSRATPHGFLQR